MTIYSRVVSLSWLLASMPRIYPIIIPFYLIWSRFLLLVFIDDKFFSRSIYHNLIQSLSLTISDSAWSLHDRDPKLSRVTLICLGIMTTCEDIVCGIYVTFVAPALQNSTVKLEPFFFGVFTSLILSWIVRWLLVFLWLLHVHFPDLYIAKKSMDDDEDL